MKIVFLALSMISTTYLVGCTFHRPTLSGLVDQVREVNEEKIALRECERNSAAIPSVTICQLRAKSSRVNGQGASSSQAKEVPDAERQAK